jgi:hypothetical protein
MSSYCPWYTPRQSIHLALQLAPCRMLPTHRPYYKVHQFRFYMLVFYLQTYKRFQHYYQLLYAFLF